MINYNIIIEFIPPCPKKRTQKYNILSSDTANIYANLALCPKKRTQKLGPKSLILIYTFHSKCNPDVADMAVESAT